MRMTTRTLALAVAGALLAGCGHKDKDAPLAFVPADTPYVVANLDVMDDDTRGALLAQADVQLPAQVKQLQSAADDMAAKDPDGARLLRAFAGELDGKTIEQFARNAGLNIKGYSAFYGLGLAPVVRFELTDAQAFNAFVGRLETAYGKKFDVADVDGQSYRRHASAEAGVQVILAVVGKQAVAALLPADAAKPLLRQALGLDRPARSLQDDGRLDKLAKAKGYQKWAVGELDLTRALPLAASGKDPLFAALFKAHAEAESAKTGEPVANQLQIPPACAGDAARIAARVPELSFGYTRLDAKHQEIRWDAALAPDITQAFAGLKVELPGLGADAQAPFDLALALPVAQLRAFWSAQSDAVAAKPFACPALADLNDTFAKLGPAMQKAAIPPFGDLLGVRVALDSLDAGKDKPMPSFTGRLVLSTNNPAGLLAMGQMMNPALAQLKLAADGKPVALPPAMTQMLNQPAWLAMGDKSLALGIGAGEDAKLADTLKAAPGNAGQMLRMNLDGAMYRTWVGLMQDKADSIAAAAAALDKDGTGAPPTPADQALAASRARTKAQFDAMRAQAERIRNMRIEAHVEDKGLVVTGQTELK
ncbi:hypothetical protein [Fulvimonas soli]|uniref:Uncharacterized protein n=1 Tax=Fulvimonas soli TaxID=155197 RepID=A0A316HVG9_9GAMM|nr:hypothetical protein [Fulvimonas soli]PWK84732.1 hypothetical protein C7456_11033 [Fulvimonas soli]TNY25875.1 hypothetical protein BV497_11735 [Fulvimonas soli]